MPVTGTTNDEKLIEVALQCNCPKRTRGWAGLVPSSPFRSLARTPFGTTSCCLEREHARETHQSSGVHRIGQQVGVCYERGHCSRSLLWTP